MCSAHFDADSYSNEYKMIDYLGCYTRVLKPDAIPTLVLPQPVIIKATFDDNLQQQDSSSDEIKNVLVFHVDEAYSEQTFSNNTKREQDEDVPTPEDEQLLNNIKTPADYCRLAAQNAKLRTLQRSLAAQREKLRVLLEERQEASRAADVENQRQLRRYREARNKSRSYNEQLSILSKVFSESQIKILSGKKKIYWSNDDMAMGYTVRHMSSKRCYVYLTKTLNIPLPALSSIKRWVTLKKAEFGPAKVEKEEEDGESD